MKAKVVTSLNEYGIQVKKRFLRLMPAYFLFAGVVFFAKWGAQGVMHVDNPVHGLPDLIRILLYPMQSISAFLWYIYVLFLFCTVSLALMSLTRGRILPLVVFGTILLFIQGVSFLGMDQFCKYFLFFSLGGLAARYWQGYGVLLDWLWFPTSMAFMLMLLTSSYRGDGWILTALLSLPALHGLCRQRIPVRGILLYLGLMSFPIYLMNTLSIGLVKAVLLKFMSWDGMNFLLFAPVLTMAGLGIPILVKRYLIRRVGWLDRVTS